MSRTSIAVKAALVALGASVLLLGCGGHPDDTVTRETLTQASLQSAAAPNYVAVVGTGGPTAVTFTYAAPNRLRAQQGDGKAAVVFVQVALTGYHSDPKHPGHFTRRLENVPPDESAPLNTVTSLISRANHVTRMGNTFMFDVTYGSVKVRLRVDLDASGRIAAADLPVFNSKSQVASYKRVTFSQYGHAPAVVTPAAQLVTPG